MLLPDCYKEMKKLGKASMGICIGQNPIACMGCLHLDEPDVREDLGYTIAQPFISTADYNEVLNRGGDPDGSTSLQSNSRGGKRRKTSAKKRKTK